MATKKSTTKSTKSKKPAKTTSKKPAKTTTKASASSSSKKSSSGGKGKIIAATAGVAAAAAAAGVAYYRGTKGGESTDKRSIYHILPGDDGWQVKGEGAERAVSNHSTKKEALSAARELAHNQVPSQLVVHKSDGTIQESWSYDADSV